MFMAIKMLALLGATSPAILAQTPSRPAPCGTPHFVIPVTFSVTAAPSADDSHVLQLEVISSGGFSSLLAVELVPEEGGVTDLMIPERRIRLGDPLVFLISRNRLRPHNDYRVLITTSDSSSEP
jgi:hypothetical protein